MYTRTLASAAVVTACLTLLTQPVAQAAPSCVAQTNTEERAAVGTAWGREVVASLAADPAPLQELGFERFGDLAKFVATQPSDSCSEG